MRRTLIALALLMGSLSPVLAEVNVGIGINLPGVSIGINLPAFPQLVPVPGYPVYYAPQLPSNYFFYEGMYWVYEGDDWYASSWYNGPWNRIGPERVPLFVLRIPVRYYRSPPPYFRGWRTDAAPRWGEHWGPGWEDQRRGWDRWDRRAVPAPAPLPTYQRRYDGDRYPQREQQQTLRERNYRYQPRDADVRQHFREQNPPVAVSRPSGPPQGEARRPPPEQRPVERDQRNAPRPPPEQRPAERDQRNAPRPPQEQRPVERDQRNAPRPPPEQRPVERDQRNAAPMPPEKAIPERRNAPPESRRAPDRGPDRGPDRDREQERNK